MSIDVLIVEDEPVVARSAERILRTAKLTTCTVANAKDAVAELGRTDIKVALCDLMLPGASGLSVLGAAGRHRPSCQIVMVTGYATCEKALESFRMGAFDFLPKPFDVDELLATTTRAIRAFERRRSAGDSAVVPTGEVDSASDVVTRHLLGRHAWAVEDADGSVTFGLGETFPGLLGHTEAIELPSPHDHVSQCRQCAVIHTGDGYTHRVWAPLTGRVVAVNRELEADPSRLDHSPWEELWLMRVIPEYAEQELANLVHH